jgi:hypothetical protein
VQEVSCARGKDKTTSADQDGTLNCATALFEYKFNLKNNRFLRAYLVGYVNGMNENSNTPYVSGGTCIKGTSNNDEFVVGDLAAVA